MERSNTLIHLMYTPSAPETAPVKAPRRAAVRRCQCGECAPCRDNARWERIFQEKFADPTYYSAGTLRHRSSLSDCSD